MRFIFIFIGAALIAKFSWIMYVFGGFLVFTGIKMFWSRNEEEEIDPQNHPVVKFANKYFKVHNAFVGNKFFVKIDGIKKMTPLFLVLIIIEFTDLIFAVDSIPAIFAITNDPFIVLTANIFAILGLRALYFLLADLADRFHLLPYGLALVLVFIGTKMLMIDFYKIPIGIALAVTASLIGSSMLISIWSSRKKADEPSLWQKEIEHETKVQKEQP